ncbi:MAG TPA: YCF48-related protein [Pyrinomonadaceae bacterium]|nr:YCF48-related protein [Pyrinomonadaceae bacterium]
MSKYIFLAFCLLLIVSGFWLFNGSIFPGTYFDHKWKLLTDRDEAHAPPFQDLVFFDSKNGVSIAFMTIQTTSDGGVSWTQRFENDNGAFYGLYFGAESVLAVGTQGGLPIILSSSDHGVQWKKEVFAGSLVKRMESKFTKFYDVCTDSTGKLWIAGDNGIVSATIESDWLTVNDVFETTGANLRIACGESGNIWAISDSHTAVSIHNNRIEEKKLDTSIIYLMKIKIIDSKIWILGGDGSKGITLKSQNEGQTWDRKEQEGVGTNFDIAIIDGKGWMVGAGGAIFYTTDDGNSWRRANSPTQNDLLNIFFLDSQHGWITGDKATVLKYQN